MRAVLFLVKALENFVLLALLGKEEPMKNRNSNMQGKTKKKKEKEELRIQDLRPTKDVKGGMPPGPCGPGSNLPAVQGPGGSH